jgi:hypothetical protein
MCVSENRYICFSIYGDFLQGQMIICGIVDAEM